MEKAGIQNYIQECHMHNMVEIKFMDICEAGLEDVNGLFLLLDLP